MRVARLDDMVRGWFVGAFTPTACSTDACEVAIRPFRAGDAEAMHFHKVATEITAILSGVVEMCGRRFGAGDIIVLDPGDRTDFRCIEDCVTVVVKVPGALNDKYLVE
jgi:anti-sigma factor ChrR (cupin superfamily)